ncbi:hypothetical protein GLYMA_17G053850v4 [Glycine max]|nr:hypothetical protein GYH30_046334 [Glycine max]KRH02697.2 hypothetical protein GLYMA_17G053850v4 [Glycine max]
MIMLNIAWYLLLLLPIKKKCFYCTHWVKKIKHLKHNFIVHKTKTYFHYT